MYRRFVTTLLGAALVAAGAGSIAAVLAQEEGATVNVTTLPQDPAFDRYVDMDLLADAWQAKDAALLTDLALAMAEGERILQRPRRGIAASDVFGGAIKSAAELRDAAALARLTTVLGNLKRDDLLAQASTAKRLASASRSVDPGLTVQADTATPATFFAIKSMLEDIASAKIAGDRAEIRALRKEIDGIPDLSERQRHSLDSAANEAIELLPTDNDPASSALNKLLGESRGGRGGGGGGRSSGGSRSSGGRSSGMARSSGGAARSSSGTSHSSSSRVGSSASRMPSNTGKASGSSASKTTASNSSAGKTSGTSGTSGTGKTSGTASTGKSGTGTQGSSGKGTGGTTTNKGTGGNTTANNKGTANKSDPGHIRPTGGGSSKNSSANRGTANRNNGGRDHGGRDHGPHVRLDRHARDLFRNLYYITGRRSFIYSGSERLYFGDYYINPGDEILSVGSYCCCNTRFNLDQLIDMAIDDGDPVMVVRDCNSGEQVNVSLDDSGGGDSGGGVAPDSGGDTLVE